MINEFNSSFNLFNLSVNAPIATAASPPPFNTTFPSEFDSIDDKLPFSSLTSTSNFSGVTVTSTKLLLTSFIDKMALSLVISLFTNSFPSLSLIFEFISVYDVELIGPSLITLILPEALI